MRERVAAVGARDGALVLRLELVVELLGDPLAQLGVDRLDVEAGREPLDQRQQQREVAQVGVDRLGDARVLDLDRDGPALARHRAVHLADRRGGERLLLELGEDRRRLLAQLLAQQLLDRLNGSGGTSSRSLASVCLKFSRSSSGSAVKSIVESTCPTFIAAPRIWPSCSTSSRASAAARSPVAASARSGERTTFAARVPTQRADCPATSPPRRRGAREARGGRLARLVGIPPGYGAARPGDHAGSRLRRVIRAFGPGRVNLIGEHTDYNGGLALPFAIDRGVTVEAEPRDGGEIRAEARDVGEPDVFPVGRPRRAPTAGARSCAARSAELRAAGVDGARARGCAFARRPAARLRALLLRRAGGGALPRAAGRWRAPRSPTASSWRGCARASRTTGSAPRPGCSTSSPRCCGEAGARAADRLRHARRSSPSRSSSGDWRLVTLESGAEHAHAAGGYNERRAECRAACAALGVEHARAGRPRRGGRGCPRRWTAARGTCSPRTRASTRWSPRCAPATSSAAGRLLDASHASLRDDYEASVPEVEDAVAALKRAGAAGARMVGGGFGGSVLALLPPGTPLLPGRPRSLRGVRRVVFDPPGPRRRGRTARAPPARCGRPRAARRRRSRRRAGARDAQARKSAPMISIATPTHRLRFQPAAFSMSASEAPRPEDRTGSRRRPRTAPPMMRRRSNRLARCGRARASSSASSDWAMCGRRWGCVGHGVVLLG